MSFIIQLKRSRLIVLAKTAHWVGGLDARPRLILCTAPAMDTAQAVVAHRTRNEHGPPVISDMT